MLFWAPKKDFNYIYSKKQIMSNTILLTAILQKKQLTKHKASKLQATSYISYSL